MQFIPVMQSWNFSIITPVLVSHDPSEIILICWSAAEETYIIIISVLKIVVLLNIFCRNLAIKLETWYFIFFSGFFDK